MVVVLGFDGFQLDTSPCDEYSLFEGICDVRLSFIVLLYSYS